MPIYGKNPLKNPLLQNEECLETESWQQRLVVINKFVQMMIYVDLSPFYWKLRFKSQ